MPSPRERTARHWFQEAARLHIEAHQGCPSCGRQHCVFQASWGARLEYYCSACDFSVCFDRQHNIHLYAPGDGHSLAEALFDEKPTAVG